MITKTSRVILRLQHRTACVFVFLRVFFLEAADNVLRLATRPPRLLHRTETYNDFLQCLPTLWDFRSNAVAPSPLLRCRHSHTRRALWVCVGSRRHRRVYSRTLRRLQPCDVMFMFVGRCVTNCKGGLQHSSPRTAQLTKQTVSNGTSWVNFTRI